MLNAAYGYYPVQLFEKIYAYQDLNQSEHNYHNQMSHHHYISQQNSLTNLIILHEQFP